MELRNYPKPNHNYQTETAISLTTKYEKTIKACSYLNFPIQKIHQNSKKWLAFVRQYLVKMTLRLF